MNCPLHAECFARASEAETILVHFEREMERLYATGRNADACAARALGRLLREVRSGRHRVPVVGVEP